MTINWDIFYIFTIVSVILWIISAVTSAIRNRISKIAVATSLAGSIVFLVFIVGLWIYLQRPPLRTMGETRLWYSLFMGISGPVTDASPAKHLVYSARHRIYVLILRTWLCIYNRVYRAEKA